MPKNTLLKAAAVNALYGTQVYAVAEVAEHLCSVLGNTTVPATPALVEELAKVKFVRGSKHITWTFRSFTSKFAHFFIDPDQFPIYDSYAVKMLTYHLNGKGREGLSYEQFAAGFSALKLPVLKGQKRKVRMKTAGFAAKTGCKFLCQWSLQPWQDKMKKGLNAWL